VKTFPWLTACMAASGMVGWPVQAQATPSFEPAPTIRAAPATLLAAPLEAAWQRAVLAKETEGQLDLAEAARPAATSWRAAPPALELSHRDDRWQTNAGRRKSGVAIAWPLWLPGQHGAAVDAASAHAARRTRPWRPPRHAGRTGCAARVWRQKLSDEQRAQADVMREPVL
jgi:outer membrane protein, heavy metal efflux system